MHSEFRAMSDYAALETAPAFDVVVPAYNEASHINSCLDAILAQNYRPELVRVWVVDAGSTDATAELVQARAGSDPRIRLVQGLGRLNTPQAMNAGIACGSAQLIARVDGHSYLAPDYLSRAAEVFSAHDERLACAGGHAELVGETFIGRGIALARRSRFGVGGGAYAERRASAYVDTVPTGVYRRSALAKVGGFATDMLWGEDEEVNWRLRGAGYLILLNDRLRCRYMARSTWFAAFRQYCHYGQGRARVLAAHSDFLRPHHLVPSTFLLGMAVLAVAGMHSPGALVTAGGLLLAYVAAALGVGVRSVPRDELALATAVAMSFPALHLGYAVGFLQGSVRVLRTPVALQRRVNNIFRADISSD